MELTEYIKKIEQRLERYFDITKDYNYRGEKFLLFAKSSTRNEKYFASKKVTIYAFENSEYCFIKYFDKLEIRTLVNFFQVLKQATGDFIAPHHEHMCTIITGIIIVNENVSDELKKEIKKLHFNKSFCFGFKGWVYIRVILVHLERGVIISNKKGKEVISFYEVKD